MPTLTVVGDRGFKEQKGHYLETESPYVSQNSLEFIIILLPQHFK